jgi:aminoglycoside phosphotransferase (APT) family kinase protein
MPGSVPRRWGYFADEQVSAAGRLLRAFHEATRGSVLAGASPVVCHNDFSPSNTVFVDDRPVAMIDFDMASPGKVLEDLGYTAWAWCISSKSQRPAVDVRARQVRILAEAYGDFDQSSRMSLMDAVLSRLERNARFWQDMLDHPQTIATPRERIPEMIEWSQQEARFVTMNRAVFEAALS